MKDRTDASALEYNAHLPDLDSTVSEVLLSDDDLRILKENMSVIAGKCIHYSFHCILIKFYVGRIIRKYCQFFEKNFKPVPSHITHPFSEQMAKKSEVVCSFDNNYFH